MGIDPDSSRFYNLGWAGLRATACLHSWSLFWSIRLLRQHDTLLCHSFFLLGGHWLTTQTRNVGPVTFGCLFDRLSRRRGTATLFFMGSRTCDCWLYSHGCWLGCLGMRIDSGWFHGRSWGSGVGFWERAGKRTGKGVGTEGHPERCWPDSWFPACNFGGHHVRGWRVEEDMPCY